jgi:hypothetical protein
MNRRISLVFTVLVVLAVLSFTGTHFLPVSNEARFNESVAYFDLPESPDEPKKIRLRITAKAEESEIKNRIEQHREEVRDILLRAIAPDPGRPTVLRDSRRAILKVLCLENQVRAVTIEVVPDFSAMSPNRKVRELLETAHREQMPAESQP